MITVDDYGEYDIHVLNPYDTKKLKEELSSLAIQLNGNKLERKGDR